MNNNENKCEDNEYVFVELYPTTENDLQGNRDRHDHGVENMKKNKAVKSGSRFKTLFSSRSASARKGDTNADMNTTKDDTRNRPSDDFWMNSFDLCDEEFADMDIEIDGPIDMDLDDIDPKSHNVIAETIAGPGADADAINSDSLHLELSQCPSASASVCTETMFDTLLTDANSVIASNGTVSDDKQTTHSRLSNKKRRKKLKKQKKAAAAAAAAEALASKQSQNKTCSTVAPSPATSFALPVSIPVSLTLTPKSRKKAASIAVLCAAQSLAQYRQEIGIANMGMASAPSMNIRST